MPKVFFSPHLAKHLAVEPVAVEGTTVGEALAAAFGRFPGLKGYVVDDQGAVRKHVMIFVNDGFLGDRETLADTVGPETEIHVMQALSGG